MTFSPFSPGPGDPPSAFGPIGMEILDGLDGVAWRREMLPDGTIRYPWISGAVTGLLGFAPDELRVGAGGTLGVVHWADRDGLVAAIHDSARTLAPCRKIFRAITATDETRWLRESAKPCRLADGTTVWDGVWLDDTRWMRAEARNQLLMDHAEDCIFVLSGDGRILWYNAAARRRFGFATDLLVGQSFSALIGYETEDSFAGEGHGVASPLPVAGSTEVIARRPDGSTFPFEMTVSEARSDGRLSLIVIGRDITRRRDAERQLAESEHRLRLTFAAASLGIVVIGLDGIIEFYNPAFECLTGEGRDTLLGTSLFEVLPPEVLPPPGKIPPPGMAFCVVCRPHLGDGAPREWRMTGTSFQAAPGVERRSILFFVEDVTETNRLAEERRQLERLLLDGQKLEALGRLAGGIAHELNNMLGPILMGAEMIARTAGLDERNAERVQRIIAASKNSRDIVRNVLAYCRKEQKSLEPLDLVQVFDGFAAMVASILPPTVRVERVRELECAVVIGDSGQITQVLLNLVNNARDAMNGTGTVWLTLGLLTPIRLASLAVFGRPARGGDEGAGASPFATLPPGHDYILVSVGDSGCGMDPLTIERIFDPFFTTKPVGQGTGLGLSVVQGIVKSMGGAITVTSRPGQGSTFHVVLPLHKGATA
jgi:PAS domain S-box-containing protein